MYLNTGAEVGAVNKDFGAVSQMHLRWLNTVLAVCEYVICQIMARERLQLTS